ncbi:DUF4241 domain-containing protein [Cryobacterium sp. TMS1-20-1]|uniref:DUF4241 domain-containing protein n=1 Tax=Cryobacterium sp. TMS1-20-1 TaxID=1259223 RepID=UPI00141B595D|nr:DUF4241 domain-containing protein [Cryobacterium sp. TMS1-20-1]
MDVLQLAMNTAALVAGAFIWRLYVGNLKAALTARAAEISSVEKNRDFWKDKAQELEKRSPEFMERTLEERIQTRESEIIRLKDDKEINAESLTALQREKANIESDLLRTRGFRLMLALEEREEDDDMPQDHEIQVVFLGEVGVDSGMLMITDPCYIDDEWQGRLAHDGTPGDTPSRQVRSDPADDNAQALPPYSFRGACETTNPDGYGELGFKMGHAGAGVVFHTAWGDGAYPIYGELHDGRIIRAYINVR